MFSSDFLQKALGSIYPPHFVYDFQKNCFSCYTLLANSANTKYRPFHAKINCSKFRIDKLQQLRHVTFLIFLFLTSRNYYCLV